MYVASGSASQNCPSRIYNCPSPRSSTDTPGVTLFEWLRTNSPPGRHPLPPPPQPRPTPEDQVSPSNSGSGPRSRTPLLSARRRRDRSPRRGSRRYILKAKCLRCVLRPELIDSTSTGHGHHGFIYRAYPVTLYPSDHLCTVCLRAARLGSAWPASHDTAITVVEAYERNQRK